MQELIRTRPALGAGLLRLREEHQPKVPPRHHSMTRSPASPHGELSQQPARSELHGTWNPQPQEAHLPPRGTDQPNRSNRGPRPTPGASSYSGSATAAP